MKKTLLTVAAASLLFGLVGCSDPGTTTPATPAQGTTGGVVVTATPAVNGSPMAPITATATPGQEGTVVPDASGTPAPDASGTPAPDASGTPAPATGTPTP